MSRVVRSEAARRDLEEIWLYVAQDDANAADGLLMRIEKKAETIADAPLIGTPRPELGRNLRSFVLGRYVIVYRPLLDGIRLIRIFNAARDTRRVFRR